MRAERRQHLPPGHHVSVFRRTLALVLCGMVSQATLCLGQNYPAPDSVGAVIGAKPGATLDNQRVERDTTLQRNAVLRTDHTGRVRIRLRGGEVLTMGGDTEVMVPRNNPVAEQAQVRVLSGRVRSNVGHLSNREAEYELTTAQAGVSSNGNSDFYLEADRNQTRVIVYSGIVLVRSLHGPSTAGVDVAAGQTIVVTPSAVSRLELTAEDLEQESMWQTSFPDESLTESNPRPARSHKKLYIILGAAGAAVGGIAMAARGGGSKSSAPSTTTVPSSVPTIPAQ